MDLREFLLTQIMLDADKGGGGGTDPQDDTKDEGVEGDDEGDKDTGDDPGKKDEEPKTFTQEELDRIIADRLAREQKKRDEAVKKAEEEAEQKRLEEQGEYKKLAEKLQKQVDEMKAEVLSTKKVTLLKDAGYSEAQIELFTNLLQGETDEELAASLELLKKANPPVEERKYVDPSSGNGRKNDPSKKGADEIGKSVFQRLKAKGKIK